MSKTTNVPRELLERIDESAICDGTDATISDDLFTQLVAALAAPRQPEGEVLEVVAWQDADNPLYTTGERRQMHGWATDGYPIVELCRLSDAQRAIAELREECERLRKDNGLVAHANLLRAQQAEAERDTLRQQRDKLVGLLREKFPRIDPENPYPLDEVEHYCEYMLYQERERLHREIDAALAEVNK